MEDTLPSGRRRLLRVLRASGDVIRIGDAASALSIGRSEAAKLLSRWVRQGWLRRVGRGMYVPASLESLDSEQVLDDPWILVPALFAPAYIGGRTAAEHWDLTEQVFRDIVVMTTRHVRERSQVRHGARFTLHRIPPRKMFGTRVEWRGKSRVDISDVHKTIVDMLDTPAFGGGIQHVFDCTDEYLQRSDRNDRLLVEYGERNRNGAVFKRLGFLAERRGEARLADECRLRLTKGNAKLDPALKCSNLVSRWHLWIPSAWLSDRSDDR